MNHSKLAALTTQALVLTACLFAMSAYGQNVDYLISTLQAYRDNLRLGGNSAMMSPQAANLTDQDISDIAAYYGAQTPVIDSETQIK